MSLPTDAIHAGQHPDPTTGAIMTPLFLTSTYVQEAPGKHKGYDYSRTANPTRTAVEANLAALEGGAHGLAFSSGCGAATTVLSLLSAGDHVVSGNDIYGGTYRLFKRVFEKFGLAFTFVDTTKTSEIKSALRPNTKMLWLETPSNPLLRVTDLAEAARIAHAHSPSGGGRVLVVADNTFATPCLQQPLAFGSDVVLHSTTKYLGGHSDIVGGALVMNDAELKQKLAYLQNAIGAVPGAFDAWLLLRSTKTLPVRMARHCENAKKIAAHLRAHRDVAVVNYPGLEDHPQHAIARKQMKDFGGMISFELKGTLEQAVKFVSSMKLFALAESLGGVESLVDHPAVMTHASIPREERMKAGLNDGLIRLSVGLEDASDLIADLEKGFEAARRL